jgi:hypothetical protein
MFDRRQQDELWATRIMSAFIISKRTDGHKTASKPAGGGEILPFSQMNCENHSRALTHDLEFDSTCKGRPNGLEC